MYSVKESKDKGKCKACGKGPEAGPLYKISVTEPTGKGREVKKRSHYLCKACCVGALAATCDKVTEKRDEDMRKLLEGTKYDARERRKPFVRI
jgi:hypothetical protein